MAGNREGGIKAAKKTKELYGEDIFRKSGVKGGKNSRSPWHGDSNRAREIANKRWEKYRANKLKEEANEGGLV